MSQRDNSYAAVMARSNEIMKASVGMDYDDYVPIEEWSRPFPTNDHIILNS